MTEPRIKIEEVKKQLDKIKEKKSPGPDGIQPELYKTITKDEYIIKELTDIYNNIINGQNSIPKSWTKSKSKTVMIPKIKKTQIKDLRHIALTNISYKICAGILKEKIETHMRISKQALPSEEEVLTIFLY